MNQKVALVVGADAAQSEPKRKGFVGRIQGWRDAAPADEVDQRIFKIVPVPFDLCVHLKLFDGLCAVDVVGDGVAEGVWVRGDEIPPAIVAVWHYITSNKKNNTEIKPWVKGIVCFGCWEEWKGTYVSQMMGDKTMSNLEIR